MFLVKDNFASYNLGSGLPTGFQTNPFPLPPGGGTFVIPSSPTPAVGFYERTGIIYQFSGQMNWPARADLSSSAVGDTTVWFATLSVPDVTTGGFFIGELQLASIDPSTFSGVVPVTLSIEGDYSISVNVPGVSRLNTLKQVIYPYTWHIVQLKCAFGSTTVSGVPVITVTVSLAIDGVPYLTNVTVISTIPLSFTWNNAATINQWTFFGAPLFQDGTTYYGEIAFTDSLETFPSYPFPAATVDGRVSQMAVELVQAPPNRDGRVSQMIVELTKLPSNRNARVSQAIVELILKGSFSFGGFYVRES